MLRKTFRFAPLLLTLLAACSQAPAPNDGALRPLTHGYDYSGPTGLAGHSSGVYEVVTPSWHGDCCFATLRKVDVSGNLLWARQVGDFDASHVEGVASDADDNAYLLGTSVADQSNDFHDMYLRKYTPSGDVAWMRNFGSATKDEKAGDVAVYGSALYAVGSTSGALGLGVGGLGGWDGFIRKYSTWGTLAWTQFIGTSADDFATDVAVDSSGNVYVVGTTAGDMFIRKYSSGGLTLWTRQLHYSDADRGQAVAISGGYVYLVGDFLYNNYWDDRDVRVVKYATDGTKVWDYGYGPVRSDFVSDASADDHGNLYLAGMTYGTFAGTYQGPEGCFDCPDGYVVKLNANGSWVWGKQYGGRRDDVAQTVLAYGYVPPPWGLIQPQVYVAGHYDYAVSYLQRLSPSTGNTVWSK